MQWTFLISGQGSTWLQRSIEKAIFFSPHINTIFKLRAKISSYAQNPNQQSLSSLEQRLRRYKSLMKSAQEPLSRLSASVDKSIAQVRCCNSRPPTTGEMKIAPAGGQGGGKKPRRIVQSQWEAGQSAATLTNTFLGNPVMNQQIEALRVSGATQAHCTGNWTVAIDWTSQCRAGVHVELSPTVLQSWLHRESRDRGETWRVDLVQLWLVWLVTPPNHEPCSVAMHTWLCVFVCSEMGCEWVFFWGGVIDQAIFARTVAKRAV